MLGGKLFAVLASLVVVFVLMGCAPASKPEPVVGWLQERGVRVADVLSGSREAVRMNTRLSTPAVVGLGEATHGQHEAFDVKRRLTMHLIKNHGYRVVAYETSASSAVACDAYVQSESDTIDAGMSGFDMMIWHVEENARLLQDLRAWNVAAAPGDKVRFIGVDVQDTDACAKRLSELLSQEAPELASRTSDIAGRINDAINGMISGSRAAYDTLVAETDALINDIDTKLGQSHPRRVAILNCAHELKLGVTRHETPGARDAAMAQMLLREMEASGADFKAVLWAHNGHVTRGELRYLGVRELGMGGHLANALRDQYVAVGFAFGEGTFAALDQDEAGKWGFRPYQIDPPPEGSLEFPFARATQETMLVDLRDLPSDPVVREWVRTPHGQRWFGGYKVPANVREMTRDAAKLMPTELHNDFDMLLYIPKTTASTARNPKHVLPPLPTSK